MSKFVTTMKKKEIHILTICLSIIFAMNIFAQRNNSLPQSIYKSKIVQKAEKKWQDKQLISALEILNKTITEGKDLIEAYSLRSMLRRFNKDYNGAIEDLNRIIEIEPNHIISYQARAYIKSKFTNDYQGAISDYNYLKKISPKSTVNYMKAAHLYQLLLKYDESIEEYKKAIEIDPEDIAVHLDLSILYRGLGQSDKAIYLLKNFLESYTIRKGGLPKIEGLTARKREYKIKSDEDSVEKTVELKRSTRVIIYGNQNDIRENLDKVKTLEKLANAFALLGDLNKEKGNLQEALNNLNYALEINKNQENAYHLKGLIFLEKEEYNQALVNFNEAINIANKPFFFLNRGVAYLLKGDDKKSQEDFDKFLELFPQGKVELEKKINEARKKIQQ